MKIDKKLLTLLFISLFIFGAIARFLPHPPNFAPLTALGIFGGLYLSRSKAIALPLAARFISDALIGFFNPVVMVSVYFSTIAASLLGIWARKQKSVKTIAIATITASAIFFLVTNLAAWAFSPIYSKDIAGLIESYTLALPFWRNSLAGDFFYTTLLVGTYEGAYFIFTQKRRSYVKSRIN